MPADPISEALREWDQVRSDAEIDYPFLAQAMARLDALPAPVEMWHELHEPRARHGWFYPDGGGDAG